MTLTVRHQFHSGKADGIDSTLVKPSDWNNTHIISSDQQGIVLGRPAGAGGGDIEELPFSSVTFGVVPPGSVVGWPAAAAPTGWFLCDGSNVSRSANPTLFANIGTTFGAGDGSTTFGLPDLRGRVMTMLDGGTNRNPSFNALGVAGGAPTSSSPVFGFVDVSGTLTGNAAGTSNAENQGFVAAAASGAGAAQFSHNHNINIPASVGGGLSGTIRNDGNNGTGSFNIVQPTIAMNFIIKGG